MLAKTEHYLLQVGPFCFDVATDIPVLKDYITQHYLPYSRQPLPQAGTECFIDYYLSVQQSRGLRRQFKPQAHFCFNHHTHFHPMPLEQAHLALEWGMNWVIATQAHQYLIIHAASLEKDGQGVIITAPSGSGKSTLSAYLVAQGWQLLSDEHALVELTTLTMPSLNRPINLKNDAIDVIAPFFSQTDFSARVMTNHKGRISLLKPAMQPLHKVTPTLLVFIQYNPDEVLFVEPVDKALALTEVIHNSFNLGLLNRQGFMTARDLTTACDALYIEYSDLSACEAQLRQALLRKKKHEDPDRCAYHTTTTH